MLFWFVIVCFGLLFGCFVCFWFVIVCFGLLVVFFFFGFLLFVFVAILLFCCCCCLFWFVVLVCYCLLLLFCCFVAVCFFLFCFVLSYKLAYIDVLDATMFSNLQFKLSLAIIGGIYSGLTLTDAVVTTIVGPLTDKLVR